VLDAMDGWDSEEDNGNTAAPSTNPTTQAENNTDNKNS
jgi:hypothetical protein